jgi:hypothetical protein
MIEKRAILHIGLHKTGSTTLQNALFANREELREQRIFYPTQHLPSRVQHSHLALFLRSGQRDKYESALRGILDDFTASGCDRLVMSGEEFSTLNDDMVRELFSSLQQRFSSIRAILYVRNLYRFMFSLAGQYSRDSKALIDVETAIRRMRNFNPSKIVQRWENFCGPKNAAVHCIDKLPEGMTIVDAFAAFANVSLARPGRDSFANRSMDPISSIILSRLAFEFGLPEVVFVRPYFLLVNERIPLPKIEAQYYEAMDDWVSKVDLSHTKLQPFDSIMRALPGVGGSSQDEPLLRAADYLHFLSALTKRAEKQARALCRNRGEFSGQQ